MAGRAAIFSESVTSGRVWQKYPLRHELTFSTLFLVKSEGTWLLPEELKFVEVKQKHLL